METRLRDLYAAIQEAGGPAPNKIARELDEAAATSPASFARFLANVPLDNDCALFEIYEALLLREQARHASILLGELRRMLAKASEQPRNPVILDQLSAFAFIEDPQLTRAVATALCEVIRSSHAKVRRFAAELAGDVADDHRALQALLGEAIARDPDLRVRLLAHESLQDIVSEAELPRLSLLDRITARLVYSRFAHRRS